MLRVSYEFFTSGIKSKSLQTASNTKTDLDDSAGNGKAAGIEKDRSILAGS